MSAEFPIPLLMAAEGLVFTPLRTIIGAGRSKAYREAVIADGPVAYYRLGVQSPIADETPNGLDLAWISTVPTNVTGLITAAEDNRARDFDGVSEYAWISHSALLNPGAGDWTVEFWAKLADEVQHCGLVTKSSPISPFPQWSVQIAGNLDPGGTPGQQIQASWMEHVSTKKRYKLTTADWCDDQTHHFVVVFDSADDIRIYVDASQAAVTSQSTGAGWPNSSTSNNMELGHAPGFGTAVDGVIDEVALYDKVLSAGAITSHYNIGAGI